MLYTCSQCVVSCYINIKDIHVHKHGMSSDIFNVERKFENVHPRGSLVDHFSTWKSQNNPYPEKISILINVCKESNY